MKIVLQNDLLLKSKDEPPPPPISFCLRHYFCDQGDRCTLKTRANSLRCIFSQFKNLGRQKHTLEQKILQKSSRGNE